MKRRFLFLIFSCICIAADAQDHMFSQFFNAPIYLNPALTGQFEGDLRMNLIYRSQWANIGGGMSYISGAVDYNVPQFGGGIGLILNRSSEGAAYLNKNNVAATYAYSVGSDAFILSFGLQAGVTNRTLDFSKLVFSDQIDPRLGYNPGSTSAAEAPAYNSRLYFDAGAGINLVAGKFMAGLAMQHLNRPDESFTGVTARLPIRTTGHLSYMFDLTHDDNMDDSEKSYVIPSVIVYKQATGNSLNAGMQYKKRGINAGLWYRASSNDIGGGPSAVVISLIFDLFINRDGGEKIRFGISHDASTSRLNYTNTSGTTEGSLSYETSFPQSEAKYGKFPGAKKCYQFY